MVRLLGSVQPYRLNSGWSFLAQRVYLQQGAVREHANVVLLPSLPVLAGLKDWVKLQTVNFDLYRELPAEQS